MLAKFSGSIGSNGADEKGQETEKKIKTTPTL